LALLYSDFEFVAIALEDWKNGNMINFQKLVFFSGPILRIKDSQQVPYPFTESPPLLDFIFHSIKRE